MITMRSESAILLLLINSYYPLISACFVSPPPRQRHCAQMSRSSSPRMLDDISDLTVSNLEGSSVTIESLLDDGSTTILSCLSHFGDFNAWEKTQQYVSAVDAGRIAPDCKIVLVGIGSSESSASKFATDLDLDTCNDRITLAADPEGVVTEKLDCYRGWLTVDKAHAERWPATDVNPYVKLFGMIFGFGSPGTFQKVLYGYIGDKDGEVSSRKWVVDALLQGAAKGRWPQITAEAFEGVPAECGLRPFELATLRAQTGLHIVLNWGKLGPKDGDLFTRMGGTFVFREGKCTYEWRNKGILTYAPMDDVLKAAAAPQ
mmetsp:Transcript_7584/g.21115  ORF Transcript_7584/g.21115 Transcript_7584/m.21115 type:complete len:317 (-) Transcript_7584:1396-2346(-)